MKLIASILIVLFSVPFLSAQINSDINAPEITFQSEVIDFGNITQGSEAIRTFSFKNTGKTPLTIASIKGACGCTTFPESWPKNPIAPGASANFKVKYDTSIRIGMFDKKIKNKIDGEYKTKEIQDLQSNIDNFQNALNRISPSAKKICWGR